VPAIPGARPGVPEPEIVSYNAAAYFTTIAGTAEAVAAGDIWNVTHAFQPEGRSAAAKFFVGFEVEITPHRSQREDVSELRADTDNARFEATDAIA
jgi:hypothetical protein